MPKVLVIHGPNLNLLGQREPEVYGTETLEQTNRALSDLASELGLQVEFFQSNHEGEIVDRIQAAGGDAHAVLINPAAFTHTSVAIRDAFLSAELPFVEVHLSNIAAREDFRKKSLLADVAVGSISGFGAYSYLLGLRGLARLLQNK